MNRAGRTPLSHPECRVCNRRLARQREIRGQWRTVRACGQCGMPVMKYKNCVKCRAYQAMRQKRMRARRKVAA
jgi:hypothetical protein